MDLFLETFDVADMLAEVRATIEPLVAKNGNRLVVEAAADLGEMRSDQTKVRQTLFNLLSNAAKFTQAGHDHAERAPPASRGRATGSSSRSPTPASA